MPPAPSDEKQTDERISAILNMREPPGRLGQIVRRMKARARLMRGGLENIVAPQAESARTD
jgi:hypothetical protein